MEKPKKHLDVIASCADGGLIIGASCLTNRCWTGNLYYLDVCNADKSINIDQCKIVADVESGVTDLAWIAGTQRVLIACDSGSLEVWEFSVENDSIGCVGRAMEHENIVSTVSVNSDGSKFVSADHGGCVKIWEVDGFLPVSHYQAHTDITWCASFHRTSAEILASCSQDGQVLVWDLRQSKPAHKLGKVLPSLPTCITWQPGFDHSLAIGTESGLVIQQDYRFGVGNPVVVHMHTRLVHRVAFSSHCTGLLASVSNDCTSAVTNFTGTSGNVFCRYSDHRDFVQGVAWSNMDNCLFTCAWDGTVASHQVNCVADDAADNATITKATSSVMN